MLGKNKCVRAGHFGLLAAFVFAISGCAGDFVEDPNRPAPTRAVRSNPGGADALSETMRDTPDGGGGINLVTVDLPNQTQTAQVHTILDHFEKCHRSRLAAPHPTGNSASTDRAWLGHRH